MSCSQDRSLCLWNPQRDDMKDGFLIKRYKGPHSNTVNDVSMYAYCTAWNIDLLTIRVLCLVEMSAIFSFGTWRMHVSFGGISVIHRYLIVYSIIQRVNSVCFNKEGTVFASGSYDTTVKLWDVRSHDRGGQCIQTLPEAKDSIISVILDETSIISGFSLVLALSYRSVDGSIRSYDIRAGMMNQEQLNGT